MIGNNLALGTALLGVAGLFGCAATVPADAGFEDVQRIVAERTSNEVHWNRGTPADLEVMERVRALLGRELACEEAVQIALLNNAGLQATYEDLGIAQADLVEAGLLKNPLFEAEVRFPQRPRFPLEAHILQDFLDVFLLPLRKRVAAARFEHAKLEVAGAVMALAADVRSAFFELQGSQQMLEMRRSVVESSEASAEFARRLREAGNIKELDLESEQAMLEQAKLDLAQAEADVLDARERLNSLMGLWGDDTGWTISNRLPELPEPEIAVDGLESQAVSRSLALQASRQELEATAQSLGLVRSRALIPEVNVGIHSEREPEGLNTVGPSIGFVLPVFNQGQPMKARALAELRQAQQRYVDMAIALRAEVRRLRNRMLAFRNVAEYRQKVVIPLRGRIIEHTQLEYNAMQTGVFQLLQAKQAEIDAGREYIGALRDYWVARTELERAVGGRLDQGASSAEPHRAEPDSKQGATEKPEHHHGERP